MAIQCNVGGADKVFRIVLGVVLVALTLFVEMSASLKVVAWIIAAIALISAFVGFCPVNKLIGLNTCKPTIT